MPSEEDLESVIDVPSASTPSSSTPRSTSRYTTKRPHKKSRAGCILCKQRKIKCDEQHPQCTPCKKRKIQCSFSPAPEQAVIVGPSTALVPTNGLNSTDLRLMHHFATSTAESLAINRPGMEGLLRSEIPSLAFQHDYLMHCILGISSLHLEAIAPSRSSPLTTRKSIVMHHVSAISGFRRAIASISPSNAEAVLLTSLFLLIVGAIDSSTSGDGEQWIMSWLGLHTGIRAIIDSIKWDAVQSLSIGPVFSRGNEPAILPVKLPLCLWEMLGSWDMELPDSQILMRSLLALGALYSLLASGGGSGKEFFLKTVSWPASLPVEFSQLARQMRPEALVILAYYLAFSKLATRQNWWMDGISDRGIYAIISVLGGQCNNLMQVPMRMVAMTDSDEMEDLLLSQLPKKLAPQTELDVLWELPTMPPTKIKSPPASSPPDLMFDMYRPPP